MQKEPDAETMRCTNWSAYNVQRRQIYKGVKQVFSVLGLREGKQCCSHTARPDWKHRALWTWLWDWPHHSVSHSLHWEWGTLWCSNCTIQWLFLKVFEGVEAVEVGSLSSTVRPWVWSLEWHRERGAQENGERKRGKGGRETGRQREWERLCCCKRDITM